MESRVLEDEAQGTDDVRLCVVFRPRSYTWAHLRSLRTLNFNDGLSWHVVVTMKDSEEWSRRCRASIL